MSKHKPGRPHMEAIRMNSFACGLPAHHRNVDSLIAYIERLEQQIEDLLAQNKKGTV